MRKLFSIVLSIITLSIVACSPEKETDTKSEVIGEVTEVVSADKLNIPKSMEGFTKIGDTVSYTALIKNPDSEMNGYMDTWLKGMDTNQFTTIIMDALLAGKLKGYDYLEGKEMTIEEIKAFDKEYTRDRIGNVLFTEDWYFDEKNLTMHKVVNSIMFGYENRDTEGKVTGHKSGIRVYLNGYKPMVGALELEK